VLLRTEKQFLHHPRSHFSGGFADFFWNFHFFSPRPLSSSLPLFLSSSLPVRLISEPTSETLHERPALLQHPRNRFVQLAGKDLGLRRHLDDGMEDLRFIGTQSPREGFDVVPKLDFGKRSGGLRVEGLRATVRERHDILIFRQAAPPLAKERKGRLRHVARCLTHVEYPCRAPHRLDEGVVAGILDLPGAQPSISVAGEGSHEPPDHQPVQVRERSEVARAVSRIKRFELAPVVIHPDLASAPRRSRELVAAAQCVPSSIDERTRQIILRPSPGPNSLNRRPPTSPRSPCRSRAASGTPGGLAGAPSPGGR